MDAKTEKKWGRFPYDRARLAQGVAAAGKARAKGVILKFFLDRAKSKEGDLALIEEMKKIPTFIQARLAPEEVDPQPLNSRFVLGSFFSGDQRPLLTAESGWIPRQEFQKVAAGVGFVDAPADQGMRGQIPIPPSRPQKARKGFTGVSDAHSLHSKGRFASDPVQTDGLEHRVYLILLLSGSRHSDRARQLSMKKQHDIIVTDRASIIAT